MTVVIRLHIWYRPLHFKYNYLPRYFVNISAVLLEISLSRPLFCPSSWLYAYAYVISHYFIGHNKLRLIYKHQCRIARSIVK